MNNLIEKSEVEARASRLRWSRKNANLGSIPAVCRRFHWNLNTYKAHESGRNGFGLSDARAYADAFGVSLAWLNNNVGAWNDVLMDEQRVTLVPKLATISAGEMLRDDIVDEAIGKVAIAGLPDGDWIALEVDGTSMDRISPPSSTIIVNRRDKRLVPNACYVIADEEGRATYKRYRPNPDRFEPVSTFDHPTLFPEQTPEIVGRVKMSMIAM